MSDIDKLVQRADALLGRIEKLLPAAPAPTDWGASIAFRWRKRGGRGAIEAVRHVHQISLGDLRGI
ncbi:MAG: AAA family ATPase, partial [Pseudomonadota bacterium]